MKMLHRSPSEMPRRVVVFVLIDGLSDVTLSELDGKTTLQAAKTPAMDAVAAGGLNGLMDPVAPGYACGSDTAHMSILGYNPIIHYRGRGSFEAMGAGLPMEKEDVAFKCNFATVTKGENGELIVEKRRVDRNFPQWGIELCSFLDGTEISAFPNMRVATKYATEHRCGVVFKGPGLCDKMTGTDPLKDHLPLQISRPLDDSPEADYSSRALNEVSRVFHERLTAHPINVERVKNNQSPANIVLMRGPGERIRVPTFEEVHSLKPFMIAPTCIIAGLGMSLGFEIVQALGATGDYHTNLLSKAETAVKTLAEEKHDFAFVHVKAVDDAGHDKDVQKKVHFIEKCDEMVDLLIRQLTERLGHMEVSIVITGDHTTPVGYGDHTFEPVPFAIARVNAAYALRAGSQPTVSSTLRDSVSAFSEIAAARGCLGRFSGDQVMGVIKNFRQYSE
ncbi:TPA: hypothetical protein N0F65_008236 [Lagenidium giganteum]|uniref:Metalloenzyme domain-containing protein n=1 Tax=Lagenidium giganteum TaxID=4803 RepID=A0AAV2Z1D3_9STRA|nr:TPA: hypothetical protein N0F65_008236 [Lagenidium giganteum]